MDLEDLQAFIQVAQEGSFSRAAEHLHLTQPAVSKRVASLESELDSRLFDRIGHRIQLTESGRLLLPRAREILRQVEDTRRQVHNLSDAVGGVLTIGTSHHIGLHRLPPGLRHFTAAYPQVDLDIRFMDSEAACRAVEQGELELAIVTLPLQPSPALQAHALWRDRLRVVVNRDHELASHRHIDIKRLATYDAILPAEGTYTRAILEQALAPHGLHLNVSLSTNYLETIKMLVSVGLGWSMLPHTMIDEELHCLSLRGIKLERFLGVVTHRERTLSNAGRSLIETLTGLRDRGLPAAPDGS